MMPAVKHLDPVLGVDIHLIITPPGAVVPIPHPHIGMVFDPFDYLPIIGSTVNVNGLPRAQAGTGGIALPPHFPIGGAFLKPPGNDNETFMGSSTVLVDEEPFTHMLLPVLSCQDIGMPRPPRKKSKGGAKSLLLPTTVALSIPAGPPVIVGGPPTISLAGLVQQLALGALLKGLKKLRKLQKASRKMKALSDRLHRVANKVMDKLKVGPRARNRVHKALCTLTGHPVDVVTGRAVTEAVDWMLPGPIPLRFERHYSSAWGDRDSVVGHGWSHSLDLAVWEEEGRVVYRAEDGREIEFDTSGLPKQQMPLGAELYEPIDRLTLRRTGGLRWEIEAADGLVHEFRRLMGQGPCRVVRTRNRTGHAIVYEYDERGCLEWVVDSAGRRLRFEHDKKGRLVSVWLPHPSQPGMLPHHRYTYSDAGDLVEVQDALGHSAHWAYEGHLLVRETDRTGLSFHFEYDGQGSDAWCVRTWGDGGIHAHRLRYDKKNQVAEVTNSLGHTTTYYSDGRGVVVREVDPLGAEWHYAYDEALRMTAEINALGHVIAYTYDAKGNRTKVVLPDGGTLTIRYNRFNLPEHATDALGGEWQWRYDALGRMVELSNPLGERYGYEYVKGLVSSVVCSLGTRTEFKYDENWNLALIKRPNGAETRCQHDRRGRLVLLRDAYGHARKYQYDAGGNLLRVEEPDGSVRSFCHDAEGNLLQASHADRQVRLGYTGFHHLAFREEAGALVRYRYDTEGQLLESENELAEKHQIVRDARGLIVEERGFGGRLRRYERDAAGRVMGLQRSDGSTTSLEYDPCGRLLCRRYPDGSEERFVYRADGALIEAINDAATVRFERDAIGRILREFQGEDWVASRYNPRGERVGFESSLGAQVGIHRNSVGAVGAVVWEAADASPWRIDLERDLLGRERGRRLPGGVLTQWERDSFGRPLRHSTWRKQEELESAQYKWAGGQRLTSVSSRSRGTTWYEHDVRGRLAAARHTDGRVESRWPDATGSVHHRPERTGRRYGPGGRLEEFEGIRYIHDADGNLTEKRLPDGCCWKYRYTASGILSEVIRPDETRVTFAYDALHRRIRKECGDEHVQWLWDGHVPLHETRGSGPSTTWLFAPESFSLLGKLEGGERYGAVCDHLGSTTELYDESGQLAWRTQMDLFGKPRTDVAETTSPWRWPGQYEDAETGLYYNRFRYYDPEAGCYTSVDPLGELAGTNSYRYTEDPTSLIDPLGLNDIIPVDLFAFGGSSGPRPPRIFGVNASYETHKTIDLFPGDDKLLHPATPPEGASTFADINEAPVSGNYHRLPKGTKLPEGLGVIADGRDVPGGTHARTHHTIYPTRPMSPEEFLEKYNNLPWEKNVGNKPKKARCK